MNDPIRLNLGAGAQPLNGWTNIDAGYESFTGGNPDALALNTENLKRWAFYGTVKMPGQAYPLQGIEDGSVDELRASHLLEHFSHRVTADVLREWVRVLKPGGVLKVAVPNFRWISEKYLGDPNDTEWPLVGYVMGGQSDERDYHKALFDPEGLAEILGELGLVDIQPWTSEVQDCAALPVSLNLMGRKPGAVKAEGGGYQVPADIATPAPSQPAPSPIHLPKGAVEAVMTMPRLAFSDNLFCATKALNPLGIVLERTSGVFWCQGMTRAIEPHLEDGTRYVLTLDYDSVFEKSDVLELLRVMETRPEIDALCALQMRREEDSPLFCVGKWQTGPKEVSIPREALEADTLPITTGHFGLTVLRVSSLKRLPRPWFLAVPDAEGGWDEGRVDADISFWKQWKEAGLTLHLANRVAIGHLQLVVSWPGRDLHLTNQFVSHYNQAGRPPDVWR